MQVRNKTALGSVLAVLLLTGSASVSAGIANGSAPVVAFKGVPHDFLYGLSIEGDRGIAVGDHGLILTTTNGTRWTRVENSLTDIALLSVVRKSGKCIATGQQGVIIRSDGCSNWESVKPVTDARLLAVDTNSNGIAYAVGGFGAVIKSSDWGKSWQPVVIDWKSMLGNDAEPHLYEVHVADDGEVTIAGEFELILRSKDGGTHWAVLHQGTRSLFGLKMLDNGEAYAVGQEGLILKSIDHGNSWNRLESGTQSILTGIWAQPDGKAVATGIYTILYSDNGGKSWQMDRSKQALSGWYQAVAGVETTPGQSSVLAVGSGGAILSIQR